MPDEEYLVEIGKADTKREGKDLTIISYSYTLQKCLQAAKELEKRGIDAEVVDLRTIYPLDTEHIIQSVKKPERH